MPSLRSDEERPDAPAADRVNVLGVGVSPVNPAAALETVRGWIAGRLPRYVCVTGAHGVVASLGDAELRGIHNRAGLVVPDGMPLVWVCRRRGRGEVGRVYGPDLMRACCARSVSEGWRHYLYGGAPGVAERLADTMRAQWPGLVVAGWATPPFRPLTTAEDDAAVAAIRAARPDIVWVGLSTPKQERWMAAHVDRLGGAVLVGVGAAFDFLCGLKPQAPRWMQKAGLEWAFRMATEPRRLGPRYAETVPRFLWHLALQESGLQEYPRRAR